MARRQRFEFGDEELSDDPFGVAEDGLPPADFPAAADNASGDPPPHDELLLPGVHFEVDATAAPGYEEEVGFVEEPELLVGPEGGHNRTFSGPADGQEAPERAAEEEFGAGPSRPGRAGVGRQARPGVGGLSPPARLAGYRGVAFVAMALVVVVVGAAQLTNGAPEGSSPRDLARRPPPKVKRLASAKPRPRRVGKVKPRRPREAVAPSPDPAPPAPVRAARPAPVPPTSRRPASAAPAPIRAPSAVSVAEAEFGIER